MGELIPLAVQTVVVALRLGLCVRKVRELVDSTETSSQSWSVLVSGLQEKDALEKIREFSESSVSSLMLNFVRFCLKDS